MVETKSVLKTKSMKQEKDWAMIVLLAGVGLSAVLFILGAFLGWFKP